MSQDKHITGPDSVITAIPVGPDRLMPVVVRIPESLVWDLERIAVGRKTKRHPMLVELIEQFVSREKGAAA